MRAANPTRLFVPGPRLAEVDAAFGLALTAAEASYLFRVRRLKTGDLLEVFDGQGHRFEAAVAGEKLVVGSSLPAAIDAVRFSFELWFGLAKGEKPEWVIQKATELGASRLAPLRTARAVVKLEGQRVQGRRDRWQKVAQEAARQSGRSEVPEIAEPQELRALAAVAAAGSTVLLLDPREQSRGLFAALQAAPTGERVALVVGPEGGFAVEEIEAVCAAGGRTVGLGQPVLRAETAAVVACAVAQLAAGGLGEG